MFRGVACLLLLLSGVVLLTSCEAINGTPMQGPRLCRYMPSVEECQYEAEQLITDKCLKKCVLKGCRLGQNLCGGDVMATCAEETKKAGEIHGPDAIVSGYVPDPAVRGQTCAPGKDFPAVYWCQVSQSPRCQTLAMVHERAHACGWKHKDGQGVPGDEGGKGVLGCKFD